MHAVAVVFFSERLLPLYTQPMQTVGSGILVLSKQQQLPILHPQRLRCLVQQPVTLHLPLKSGRRCLQDNARLRSAGKDGEELLSGSVYTHT